MSTKITFGRREAAIAILIGIVAMSINHLFLAGKLFGVIVLSVIFGIIWGNYEKKRVREMAKKAMVEE